MAEYIARELYGKTAESSSAGFQPQKVEDATNAIDCLKDHFRIDASGHVPRNISQLDVNFYDYVVMMDRRMFRQFKMQYPNYPEERLIKWRINDPWGQIDEYKACTLTIIRELRKLRNRVFEPLDSP